mmetsp:Transcript_53410/g.106272  ORF Transcript_53410/g.106272 Transcript_53410/m.106272 type:complete len:193 (-) Transcript_53410:53-631(-)|eukprot:CAMPEP_0172707684 /NCGR_PEP_ID=MMETSP1074-20121228/50114_1 /TAXON_ID=2916 /ORGANISM="Ceratium fusus, Strain PA161109" /LENGTH=192 /DNA_ID=CAMNT_0013530525 /DNA_START=98 /DNA_END=676 /DNA_ORIENTATION=-
MAIFPNLSGISSVACWGFFLALALVVHARKDPSSTEAIQRMDVEIREGNLTELQKDSRKAEIEFKQGVQIEKEQEDNGANTQKLPTGSEAVSRDECKLTPGATDSDLLLQVRQCTDALETSAKKAEAQRGRSRSLNKAYMDQFEMVYHILSQLRNPKTMTKALLEDKQAATQKLMRDCADVEAKIQKLRVLE